MFSDNVGMGEGEAGDMVLIIEAGQHRLQTVHSYVHIKHEGV